MKKRTRASKPKAAEGELAGPVVEAAAVVPVVKKRKSRAGRKKERMQISVRIDQAVMALAHQTIEARPKEKLRITDLLERGLLLALREIGVTEPVISQARLILNDEGVVLARDVLRICALRRMPQVRQLSDLERSFREYFIGGVASVETWDGYQEALRLAAVGGGEA